VRGFREAVEARILAEREVMLADRAVLAAPTQHRVRGRPPTPASRIAKVKRLHESGMKYADIAARLNLTQRQVKRTLTETGAVRKWAPASCLTREEKATRDESIRAMTRDGMSTREISESLGISPRSVTRARASKQKDEA
jgi:DNA-binding NarL/FixJ family response regulator